MYARYDATTMDRPRIEFRDFTLHACEIDDAIQMAKLEDEKSMMENAKDDKTRIEQMKVQQVPDHVLSVKSLSDAKRNQNFNTPSIGNVPDKMIELYHKDVGSGESSESEVPEALQFRGDLLLDDIQKMKDRQGVGTLSEEILKALRKVEEELGNTAPKRGELKRGLKPKKTGINENNIAVSKRQRKTIKDDNGSKRGMPQPVSNSQETKEKSN